MTSDERIEIAARLRKAHGIMAFVEALGIDLDGDWAWTDVSKRVADLIDPTCTVVSESVHTGGFGCEEAGYEFTLSCGHTVIVDGDFPPSYCDECGARVVDDEQ